MFLSIGIDNGASGSIGVITDTSYSFFHTPIKKELSYTKTKKFITRVDHTALYDIFEKLVSEHTSAQMSVLLERPFVNNKMFVATLSAIRALESTLCVLERLKLPFQYIDSKEWQKTLLPSGLKGTEELKKASLDVGTRLFPIVADGIKKHKDADGLLIAEYGRRRITML